MPRRSKMNTKQLKVSLLGSALICSGDAHIAPRDLGGYKDATFQVANCSKDVDADPVCRPTNAL